MVLGEFSVRIYRTVIALKYKRLCVINKTRLWRDYWIETEVLIGGEGKYTVIASQTQVSLKDTWKGGGQRNIENSSLGVDVCVVNKCDSFFEQVACLVLVETDMQNTCISLLTFLPNVENKSLWNWKLSSVSVFNGIYCSRPSTSGSIDGGSVTHTLPTF